jgi:hypothetical protein
MGLEHGSDDVTTTPGAKARLLDWARRERAGWELLLAEVGEARMTEPGPMGDWSFKDLLAHLTAWQLYAQGPLEEALHGDCPTPPWPANLNPEEDQTLINRAIHERTRQLSVVEVIREGRLAWDQLEAGLSALPEEVLTRPQPTQSETSEPLGAMVVREATAHFHQDHEAALRAWLAGFTPPADEV